MNVVRVKLSQGVVRGCQEQLPDGRLFQRFSGIPYAKPPLNELRFRSPQKLLKFNKSEIDCTKERDACFHRHIFEQTMVGSEDCLYLNVYVPPVEIDSKKKLSVMVYIHGGGFAFDSSSIEWYSPEYLLMENVIVVTFNYRLHVLGFLSLPSMDISGNAGLKDQQMALQWVYDNIANFNGDPNKISLFGESAGGASVHLQVLNQKSRTFINGAICQSGSALGDWVLQRDAVGVTKKLAKILGAKTDSDEDALEALMSASVEDLFRLKSKPQDPDDRRRNLVFTFKPSIELESDDAFMTKSPTELIKSQAGKINTPIIFGTTDKDGCVMVASYMHITEKFDQDPVRLVPQSLSVDPGSDAAKVLGEEIKRFYFGNKSIDENEVPSFVDHMTDFHFFIPQVISVELHRLYQPKERIFLYEFRFDGKLNLYKRLLQMQDIPGAAHADDICYLFKQRSVDVQVDENSKEHKMRRTMCKMWTNFTKFSDPTPNESLPIKWRVAVEGNNSLDYLIIDDEENMKMERNLNESRVKFWRDVYRRRNKNFLPAKL